MGIFEKKPQDKIRSSSKNIRHLEAKRETLNPRLESKQIRKIDDKIAKNKTEISIGYAELKQPKTEIKNITNNVSYNKSKKSLGGAHYHKHEHKDKK